MRIISFVVFIAFATVSVVFPFENMFVDFKTPQAAYSYYRNSPPIYKVIEGEDSCFVISQTDDFSTIQQCLFLKKDGKFKLPTSFSYKTVSKYVGNIGMFELINFRGTDDYYLNASYFKTANKGGLSDDLGTEFIEVNSSDSEVFSVAYLHNLNEAYKIKINGEVIELNIN